MLKKHHIALKKLRVESGASTSLVFLAGLGLRNSHVHSGLAAVLFVSVYRLFICFHNFFQVIVDEGEVWETIN